MPTPRKSSSTSVPYPSAPYFDDVLFDDDLDRFKGIVRHHAWMMKEDHSGRSTVYRATERNSIKILSYVLKKGGDANSRGQSYGPSEPALHYAVRRRHVETTKLLVKHGADLQTRSQYLDALDHAIAARNPDIASLLLDAGANLDIEFGFHSWFSKVHAAAKYRAAEVLEVILSKGGNPFYRIPLTGIYYPRMAGWRPRDMLQKYIKGGSRQDRVEAMESFQVLVKWENHHMKQRVEPILRARFALQLMLGGNGGGSSSDTSNMMLMAATDCMEEASPAQASVLLSQRLVQGHPLPQVTFHTTLPSSSPPSPPAAASLSLSPPPPAESAATAATATSPRFSSSRHQRRQAGSITSSSSSLTTSARMSLWPNNDHDAENEEEGGSINISSLSPSSCSSFKRLRHSPRACGSNSRYGKKMGSMEAKGAAAAAAGEGGEKGKDEEKAPRSDQRQPKTKKRQRPGSFITSSTAAASVTILPPTVSAAGGATVSMNGEPEDRMHEEEETVKLAKVVEAMCCMAEDALRNVISYLITPVPSSSSPSS